MVEIRRRRLKPFALTVTGLASAMAAPGGRGTAGFVLGNASDKTLTSLQVATPTFSPNGGLVLSTDPITLACATQGATIYYTTDGSTPTRASTQYTGAFTVAATAAVKAFAVKPGYLDSAVASASFTLVTTSQYLVIKAVSDGANNPGMSMALEGNAGSTTQDLSDGWQIEVSYFGLSASSPSDSVPRTAAPSVNLRKYSGGVVVKTGVLSAYAWMQVLSGTVTMRLTVPLYSGAVISGDFPTAGETIRFHPVFSQASFSNATYATMTAGFAASATGDMSAADCTQTISSPWPVGGGFIDGTGAGRVTVWTPSAGVYGTSCPTYAKR